MPAVLIIAAAAATASTVYAANKSASATTDATNAAIAQQNSALAQQEQMTAPYRSLGSSAISQYEALLGISPTTGPSGPQPGGATLPANTMAGLMQGAMRGVMPAPGTTPASGPSPQTIQETLAATPGYQFTLNQGVNATKAAAGAMGMGLSGNTLQGINQYSAGLADTTYQQAVDNARNAVVIGANAATNTATNIGSAANTNSSLLMNQGNTLAGIYANEAASLNKIFQGGANNAMTMANMGGAAAAAG